MTSQVTSRRTPTTDRLAARRFALVAAEFVQNMGQRIADRRKELGLTQLELALALPGKVGADQISRWERGIHKPEDDTLEEIAAILKVPVVHFLAGEPDKAETPTPFAGQDALADRLDAIEARLANMERLLVSGGDIIARLDALQEAVNQHADDAADSIIRGVSKRDEENEKRLALAAAAEAIEAYRSADQPKAKARARQAR